MTILTYHCRATIYKEAHALAFATHPMYTERRTRIAGEFGEEFLQLGKPSINQQAKIALACLANGNDDHHQKMFDEFATYITRSKHDNSNEDVLQLQGYNDETVRAADVVRRLLLQFNQTPAVCSTPQCSSWRKWGREKPQVGKTCAQLHVCPVS